MSFLIYQIQPRAEGLTQILPIRTLSLGGKSGLFARHLPALVMNDEVEWSLTAPELLRLENPEIPDDYCIVFDITPRETKHKTFFRLEEVTGRTMSLITEALFHFRVVALEPAGEGTDEGFITKNWNNGAERYEHMRVEGGTVGGDWGWAAAPQAVEATILRKH